MKPWTRNPDRFCDLCKTQNVQVLFKRQEVINGHDPTIVWQKNNIGIFGCVPMRKPRECFGIKIRI